MRQKMAGILIPLTKAGWPQLKSDFFVETGDLSTLRDLKRFFDSLSISQPMVANNAMRKIITCLQDEAYSAKSHYNPNQPRVPAGSSDGGQWSDGGGGSGTPTQQRPATEKPLRQRITELFGAKPAYAEEGPKPADRLNVQKTIAHAVTNIEDPIKHPYGSKNCAKKVREALEAGGIKIQRPKADPILKYIAAKDFGSSLEKAGFKREVVAKSSTGYPPTGYIAKAGDVVIIQPIKGHDAGHMAIYTGSQNKWVSDFIQKRDIWPHRDYQTTKPEYIIYRFQLVDEPSKE